MEGSKFVMVFDSDAKEKLLKLGYQLLQSEVSESGEMYIFINDEVRKFSACDFVFVTTDNLNF